VQLNWTASTGVATYDVYRNGSLYFSGLTGTPFNNTAGLTAGQSDTYFIRARNSTGNTDSNTISVSIPSNICGSLPGSFTLTNLAPVCNVGSPAVQLNWTASTGVATYDVYRNGSLYFSGLTGTSFNNTAGLTAGQSYTYFIRARNSTGNTDSNTISVSIPSNICAGSVLTFTGLTPSAIPTSTANYQATFSATGTNFNNVTQVRFNWSGATNGSATWARGDSNWSSKVTVNSDTSMTLQPTVTAAGDPAGTTTWTVTLTDTAGTMASRTFTVTHTPTGTPTITAYSTSPSSPAAGQQFTINISGNNFNASTAQILFSGPGCSPCTVPNGALNTKTATLLIGPVTLNTAGSYTVSVQNGSGGATSNGLPLTIGSSSDGAALVSETVPANSQVTQGQSFTKSWIMRNSGTSIWNSGYSLQYVSGNAGCSHSVVAVIGTVTPNSTYTFSISCTAPATAGTYREDWRLVGPAGAIPVGTSPTVNLIINVKPSQTPADAVTVVLQTVPDGSQLLPGENFIKMWRLRNAGTTTWTNYRAVFVQSPGAGAIGVNLLDSGVSTVPIPTAAPGDLADLSLPMRAPAEPGAYASYWQLQNASGTPFGTLLGVQLQVRSSGGTLQIAPRQTYDAATRTLVLTANATDSLSRAVTTGKLNWSLRDNSGVQRTGGNLTYQNGEWGTRHTLPTPLSAGLYSVQYTLTDGGRSGRQSAASRWATWLTSPGRSWMERPEHYSLAWRCALAARLPRPTLQGSMFWAA